MRTLYPAAHGNGPRGPTLEVNRRQPLDIETFCAFTEDRLARRCRLSRSSQISSERRKSEAAPLAEVGRQAEVGANG